MSGIIPFKNDARRKQMFQELAHRGANRARFDANLGSSEILFFKEGKGCDDEFPVERHIILVITEPQVNIDRLDCKLINKLEKQGSEFQGF